MSIVFHQQDYNVVDFFIINCGGALAREGYGGFIDNHRMINHLDQKVLMLIQ